MTHFPTEFDNSKNWFEIVKSMTFRKCLSGHAKFAQTSEIKNVFGVTPRAAKSLLNVRNAMDFKIANSF